MPPEPYEVYAIKYAEADALPPNKVMIGADPHESPFDMAYYVWLIRRDDTAVVVDTGFNAASAAKRGRRLLRAPADGLRALGVDPEAVRTLIVTHLHYDHIGNADLFPGSEAQRNGKAM
jgi:glyoxylase-like metal-dependent hydrolase (beta-lactamase superfamily II)